VTGVNQASPHGLAAATTRGVLAVARHPLARGFSFLALGNLASRALLFLANIQLARVLSPEYFGRVVLAQTVLVFATVVADLGVRTVLVRDVAAAGGVLPEGLRRGGWGGTLLLAGMAWVAMTVAAPLVGGRDGTDRLLVALFALAVPAYGLNLDWLLKGQRRFNHVGVAEAIKALVYLGLLLAWLRSPRDVLLVPVAYAAGWVAAASYVALAVRGRGRERLPPVRLDLGTVRQLVASGAAIGVTGLLTQLYMNGGILFLKAFRGPAEIGLYGAAFKLTLLVCLMGALFSETLLPSLARAYAVSPEAGRRLLRQVLIILASVSLAAAAGFVVSRQGILHLVYGAAYAQAGVVLAVLAVAIVPLYCNIPFVNLLIVQRRQRYLLAAALIGCVANAAVNLWLTPAYGPLGAAIGELATETAVVVSLAWFAVSGERLTGPGPAGLAERTSEHG
jgi:O-antigen/teichoic acid export membrane protein